MAIDVLPVELPVFRGRALVVTGDVQDQRLAATKLVSCYSAKYLSYSAEAGRRCTAGPKGHCFCLHACTK